VGGCPNCLSRREGESALAQQYWRRAYAVDYWKIIASTFRSAQRRMKTIYFIAGLTMLSACHTTRNDVAQSGPPDDIAEARRNVTGSLKAVQSTLEVLDDLSKVSGAWPAEPVNQFTVSLARLKADSFKLREHARAMHSRGDAYFDEWQLHLSQSREPEVHQLASERQQALQDSFGIIQQASQRAGEAFKPFLSDLHALRRAFESEATSNASDSTKELIRKAKNEGLRVRLELAAIRRELDRATSNLTRA
jgi:hypothetical protein